VLHWPTVGLAFVSTFILMGSRSSFAVLYPAMVRDRGWSVTEVNGAFSSGLLLYALLAIPVGLSLDRLGCKVVLVTGAALMTVGFVIASQATEIWHLYGAYLLTAGFGACGIGFITQMKVLSHRNSKRFATAFGVAFMGQGLGSLVVSPVVQLLIEAVGWRTATLACAATVGLVLVPLAAWLAPGPQPHTAHTTQAADGAGPSWRGLVVAIFLAANVTLGFQMLVPTHQVAYLLDLGFGATLAASAAGAWGALQSVGSVGGGWLVDRLGVARVMFASLTLFTIGTVGLMLSSPAAGWLLVLYILAGGIGRGLLGLALGAAQTQTFAGPRLGRMTGTMDVGFGTGAFLGPLGTAFVHDAAGTFTPGFFATIPATAIGIACILGALRLRDRSARPAAAAPEASAETA
jgi:MFS family permease